MHVVGARRAKRGLCFFFFCYLFLGLLPSALAQERTGAGQDSPQALALDITPEGVVELLKSGTLVRLVDIDRQGDPLALPAEARLIFYSPTPAFGHARAAALRARSQANRQGQRLTGTPIEWEALKLPAGEPLDPHAPIAIPSRLLAQALRDGADVVVLDVRGSANSPDSTQPFADARALLPDQVLARSDEFPKRGWVVVVDDGGALAPQLARSLMGKGLRLVGYLQGGYAAWVDATDRDIPERLCPPRP